MFRWLVNVGLLGFPVAVTLGILIGLQSQSDTPIFNEPSSGGGRKGDNTLKQYFECNRTAGIHPPTDGQGYTFNPNPWGWKDGEPGSLCVDVLGFNNGTYETKTTAPEFWVTWQYPPAAGDLPVHAFANIMIEDTKVLPVSLGSITQLNVDLEWTYTVGNSSWNATEATDEKSLEDNLTNANVALDMFLSGDKKNSTTPASSDYEVMVWFGVYGPATQPLGGDVIIGTQTVEDVKFDLHFAHNENKQGVLTWVAATNTEKFKGDLYPLVSFILEMNNSSFPNSADYLGYVSLGTEALSATEEVTFHVPTLSIDIGTSKK